MKCGRHASFLEVVGILQVRTRERSVLSGSTEGAFEGRVFELDTEAKNQRASLSFVAEPRHGRRMKPMSPVAFSSFVVVKGRQSYWTRRGRLQADVESRSMAKWLGASGKALFFYQ